MLEVAGGIKMQWETHSRGRSPTCSVMAGWDSTREIREQGDTWKWGKSWIMTDRDPENLRTGQRVGLCEKPGAW